MASNHTENISLPQWAGTDGFNMAEFNDAFSKIDTAMGERARIAVGSYSGDGESQRFIALDFHPKAVLLIPYDTVFCYTGSNPAAFGGLALDGSPHCLFCNSYPSMPAITIDGNGFWVYMTSQTFYNNTYSVRSNDRSIQYRYIALA